MEDIGAHMKELLNYVRKVSIYKGNLKEKSISHILLIVEMT